MRTLLVIMVAAVLVGCSTATNIRGPNGEKMVMIECGAAVPASVCYERANKECPAGYREVERNSGLNRQELKVQCLP
jgi:hypothetical protein